jgi:pyruvate carboxylase
MVSFADIKIGVANRGIPAMRIGRTIGEMGGIYVAFYTEVDKAAPHVSKARKAFSLPGDNYLNLDEIIAIAKQNDISALHPGWGFAAENAMFPQMCREQGIIFIGPSHDAMHRMGNKVEALKLAKAVGVPTVPGSGGAVDLAGAKDVAAKLGFPVLIKSEGGGGGRGIVLINSDEELQQHFMTASTMAEASFGNPNLFIERFLTHVRHLEIQVVRDHFGNVVALHERDCSLQRKNQKLVEITPSPWPDMTESLRQKLKDASIALVEKADYDSLVTIEFLVDQDHNFYFMEANTRLQVEHGITERIYSIDLVEEMIRIAFGEKLRLREADLTANGCSIQCRINFEDPQLDFQPNAGRITRYRSPGGKGVRLDSCIFDGYDFPKSYDSAGALLMTRAPDWARSRSIMERALKEYIIVGPRTTIPFHRRIMGNTDFQNGEFDTKFIERTPELMTYRDMESEFIRLSYLMAEITARGYNPYIGMGAYRRFGDSKVGQSPITMTGRPQHTALPASTNESESRTDRYQPPFNPDWPRRKVLDFLRQSPFIEFCNTTPRDITQSESSNRMRLYDDRLYGPLIDQCGYCMLETGGGAHYHVNMIGNMTDPWHEAADWNRFAPFTQKMILTRSTNLLGYAPQDREVMRRTVKKIIEHYPVVRCFDFLNHIENMEPLAEIVLKSERNIFTPAISFSWAEGFTVEHYRGLLEEILVMVANILGGTREDAAREIIFVIKDMAGVAPPRFIRQVVDAIKQAYPDLIIQYHRHNTDGLGVPALGAAAMAGAKILDVGDGPAVRFYGQPAVMPVVAYLEGELGLQTRIDKAKVREAGFVLKQIMPVYDQYIRPSVLGPDHDVVRHGLPGGATSSSQEGALRQGYAFLLPYILVVLELYRKIIRYHDVTPGSQITWTNGYLMTVKAYERGGMTEVKRCIDLLRQVIDTPESELTAKTKKDRLILYEHANDSLHNLLLGKFGKLPLGWPADWVYQSVFGSKWRDAIAQRTEESPLKSLPPVDIDAAGEDLAGHIGRIPTENELVNYLNHPGDALKLIQSLEKFGQPDGLPDDIWFEGLELGEEREFHTSDGKVHVIKPIYIGRDVDKQGVRIVRYELDHEVFENRVQVEEPQDISGAIEMAEPGNAYHIGAPFDADLWIVHKQVGDSVTIGEEICNLSLMKMETAVTSEVTGIVRRVLVTANYKVDRQMIPVKQGQLLLEVGLVPQVCAGCNAPQAADHRFCAKCGAEVSEEEN